MENTIFPNDREIAAVFMSFGLQEKSTAIGLLTLKSTNIRIDISNVISDAAGSYQFLSLGKLMLGM